MVVDRVADADHPLLPYPATGSTDARSSGPRRPATREPDAPLIAYLATDAGLPRRQLVGDPARPVRAGAGSPACSPPRPTPSSRGSTPTTPAGCCCCVWNVAGGRSELELLDAVDRRAAVVAGPARAGGQRVLLSRDGSTALMAVEGPERPRELWRLDVATPDLVAGPPPRPAAATRRLVTPTLEFLPAATGCR